MRQADLDRAVARVTGETVSTIKQLGFLLVDPDGSCDPDSDEHGPHAIDWDELQAQRNESSIWRPSHEPAPA